MAKYTQLGDDYDEILSRYGVNPYIDTPEEPVKQESSGIDMFGDALQGGVSGGATGASVSGGNPYAAAAGAVIGAGTSLLKSISGNDQADKQYKAAMERYNRQLEASAEAKKEQKRRQDIQNVYGAANYAGEVQDDILSKYSDYYKKIGK